MPLQMTPLPSVEGMTTRVKKRVVHHVIPSGQGIYAAVPSLSRHRGSVWHNTARATALGLARCQQLPRASGALRAPQMADQYRWTIDSKSRQQGRPGSAVRQCPRGVCWRTPRVVVWNTANFQSRDAEIGLRCGAGPCRSRKHAHGSDSSLPTFITTRKPETQTGGNGIKSTVELWRPEAFSYSEWMCQGASRGHDHCFERYP